MQQFDDPYFRATRVLQRRVQPIDRLGEIATDLRKNGFEFTVAKHWHGKASKRAARNFMRKYGLRLPHKSLTRANNSRR